MPKLCGQFTYQRRVLSKYFRRFNTWTCVYVLSAYSGILKLVFALGIVAVGILQATTSQALVGATVFYATMIYLEDRFQYPALHITENSKVRMERKQPVDTTFFSIDIKNRGSATAEKVTARARIYDPRTGDASWWADTNSEDIDEPIPPRRERTSIGFQIVPDIPERGYITGGEIPDNGVYEFTNDAWVEIEVDTPDQLAPSWLFLPLDDFPYYDSETQSALQLVGESLDDYREREQAAIEEGN